ncbi:hypothetical protein [Streptomyces sp. UNOC14_S4]|uniref:DUF6895 family protein n=1 Tax=Streptomyces sp. UNOC14_S4 TaxID=2872340 RepID=UPI001E415A5B|nr:hypothetical protein [Streptomyces sp. UNOC14_S4]MCC3770816.1 hypothetical protein [Streptomyces sp. UNOC14_S4]
MTVPAPVAAAARSMADRALSWLHANRTLGTLPPDTTAELTDPDGAYKPLGESALAASLVLRDGIAGPGQLVAAQSLLDFAWQQYRHGDMLYERQLRHTLMTDPLEMYAAFARCGYRHAALDRLLAHHARLRLANAVELLPNRRLAVANAVRVAGLDQDLDWAALARATWLGATPEPWAINWITAYTMTHTVFHLTDWGGNPRGLPAAMAEYVRAWLPVWIDIWREVGQWDLVGELLIVGASLDEPYCAPEDWEAIAALQHEDGFVPRDGAPVPDDPEERFKEHQHTVVVTAVAGSIALARAAREP